MCHEGVIKKLNHILQIHLKKDMYCCKYCAYTEYYNSGNISKHIGHNHNGMPIEYVCNKDEYQNEINQLMKACFGSTNVSKSGI